MASAITGLQGYTLSSFFLSRRGCLVRVQTRSFGYGSSKAEHRF